MDEKQLTKSLIYRTWKWQETKNKNKTKPKNGSEASLYLHGTYQFVSSYFRICTKFYVVTYKTTRYAGLVTIPSGL